MEEDFLYCQKWRPDALDKSGRIQFQGQDIPYLHYSIRFKNNKIVKSLVESGGGVNAIYIKKIKNETLTFIGKVATIESKNKSALNYAIQFNNFEAFKYLINKGAELTPLSKINIPLHTAAEYSRIDMIEFILNQGIDINSKDKLSVTPLRAACSKGNRETIEFLLSKGAEVEDSLISLILYRFETNQELRTDTTYKKIIDLLIKFGADLNAKSDYFNENNFMWQTIKLKRSDMFLYLLNKKNININFKTPLPPKGFKRAEHIEVGNNYLHYLAHYDLSDCIKAIIEKGLDINSKNNFGETAVIIAAQKDNINSLLELIKLGADINIKDGSGIDAILYAVTNRNNEMVKLLIKHGVNLNLSKTYNGLNILEVARKYNNLENYQLISGTLNEALKD